MDKLRVAIIGQGRSGRDIHAKYFLSEKNTRWQVVCVVDELDFRRERAKKELGCEVYDRVEKLFDRKDIDLVVNASYSDLHYCITKELLLHGFHVLTEKPFSRTYLECMDLIRIAKEKKLTVTAFQQSLFSPMFCKLKEIVASGKIGELVQVNLRYSGFGRRWDWQTLQAKCGGSVYNSGPHPIGQALDLLGWDENTRVVYSDMKKLLTSGDAEDYAKILLSAPGKPLMDIEINSADAFAAGDYTFKLFGSKGTVWATNGEYRLKYIEPDSLPAQPVQSESLRSAEGLPMYCSEQINILSENELVQGSSFDAAVAYFYDHLFDALRGEGSVPATPEQAAMVVRIIEACHGDNPMPMIYGPEGSVL